MKQLHLFDNPPEQLSLFSDDQVIQSVKPVAKVIEFPVKKVKAKPAPKARIEDMIDTLSNDEILDMIRNDAFLFQVKGRTVN